MNYTDTPRARATESVFHDPELNFPHRRHRRPHPSCMSLKKACRRNDEVLTIASPGQKAAGVVTEARCCAGFTFYSRRQWRGRCAHVGKSNPTLTCSELALHLCMNAEPKHLKLVYRGRSYVKV